MIASAFFIASSMASLTPRTSCVPRVHFSSQAGLPGRPMIAPTFSRSFSGTAWRNHSIPVLGCLNGLTMTFATRPHDVGIWTPALCRQGE